MYTIDEIMTTDIYALYDTDNVFEARKLMQQKKIRHLPIVNQCNEFVGLVSNRDVLAVTVSILADMTEREQADLESSILLKDVMCRDVFIALEGVDLMEAAQHLIDHKHGCLPVLNEKKLVGIVTETDFVRLSMNLMEQMALAEPVELG